MWCTRLVNSSKESDTRFFKNVLGYISFAADETLAVVVEGALLVVVVLAIAYSAPAVNPVTAHQSTPSEPHLLAR